MKIAVVGLGSMGRRRIGLVQELIPDCVIYGVDARADRRDEVSSSFGVESFDGVESVPESVECALVCTPPLTHAQVICECLMRGWHVFTELNLVSDGYERNIALAEEKGLALFLSSTFIYRKETRYIKDATGRGAGVYRYHVGQYLPDWHPWESYKDFFVSNSRTSGVRELLAIELPWLIEAFGDIEGAKVTKRKISKLDIEYDDTVCLLIEHADGTIGNLVIDVVSRKPVRLFEYFDEEIYLDWGGTPESLREKNSETGEMLAVDLYGAEGAVHKAGYASFVIEDAYRSELECFFDCVAGKMNAPYGFEDDLKVLSFIDEIECAR